jgi:preprotein translocase subunit SecE
VTEAPGSTAKPEQDDSDDVPPGNGRTRRADGGSGKPEQKKGLFARLALFYRQVIAELRKVVWPTREQLLTYTYVVIIFCLVMIAIVYFLDLGFAKAALAVFG